jgi:hypothetical protein
MPEPRQPKVARIASDVCINRPMPEPRQPKVARIASDVCINRPIPEPRQAEQEWLKYTLLGGNLALLSSLVSSFLKESFLPRRRATGQLLVVTEQRRGVHESARAPYPIRMDPESIGRDSPRALVFVQPNLPTQPLQTERQLRTELSVPARFGTLGTRPSDCSYVPRVDAAGRSPRPASTACPPVPSDP